MSANADAKGGNVALHLRNRLSMASALTGTGLNDDATCTSASRMAAPDVSNGRGIDADAVDEKVSDAVELVRRRSSPESSLFGVRDLEGRVPGVFEGSSAFFGYVSLCCGAGVILPVALMVPLALSRTEKGSAAYITLLTTAGVMFAAALVYFIYSMRLVLTQGLPCNLPTPPPVTSALSSDQRPVHVRVRRVYVIANMTSGTGLSARMVDEVVRPRCAQADVHVTVLPTRYAGHARDYTHLLPLGGVDAIIVCGGDGSFFEALNGMLTRPDGLRVPLGILPGGSGNSLMASLGSWNAEEAMDRILSGETRFLDVSRVQDEARLDVYSINVVAIGLVGDVAVQAESCRCLGPARYDLCGMWYLAKGKRLNVRLQYRTSAQGPVHAQDLEMVTCFVNATQHFGKGLRASPSAVLDDGLADVLFANCDRGDLLALFNQIPTGAHVNSAAVTYKKVAWLEMTVQPPPASKTGKNSGLLAIDGEAFPYDGSIKIQVIPKAVQIFVPSTAMPITDAYKKDPIIKA